MPVSIIDMAEPDPRHCSSCGSNDFSEPFDFGGINYCICRRCWKEEACNEDDIVQDSGDGNRSEQDQMVGNGNQDDIVQDSRDGNQSEQDEMVENGNQDDIVQDSGDGNGAEQDPLYDKGIEGSVEIMSLSTHQERLDLDEGIARLSPGDQIMWQRSWVVCHHAIVTGVSNDAEGNAVESNDVCQSKKLKVIHWAKAEDGRFLSIEISEQTIDDPFKENGILFKIKYEKSIESRNPRDVVQKRARALLGLKDYHFFHKNCENFARFCKTGMNFNLQYPWLKHKLSNTFTSTYFTVAICFGFAQICWDLKSQFLWGSGIIIFLEMISLTTDLVNTRFLYKYPTTYLRPPKDFWDVITIRILEFVFGVAGTITGFIGGTYLSIYIVDSICTWNFKFLDDRTIRAMSDFFGILACFVLGVLGKAGGNALGIQISKNVIWGTSSGKSKEDKTTCINAETKQEKRRMIRRYLACSCVAQVLTIPITVGCIFLILTITLCKVFIGAKGATCVTQELMFLSEENQCPLVYVRLNGQRSINTSKIFENEVVFHEDTCSFQPRCKVNDTDTAIEINKYVDQFGTPGTNFSCFYLPRNPSSVIRNRESCEDFILTVIGLLLGVLIGFAAIIFIANLERKASARVGMMDNLLITTISVLGGTSYLYAFESVKKFISTELLGRKCYRQ